jgi:hypothetical protein
MKTTAAEDERMSRTRTKTTTTYPVSVKFQTWLLNVSGSPPPRLAALGDR